MGNSSFKEFARQHLQQIPSTDKDFGLKAKALPIAELPDDPITEFTPTPPVGSPMPTITQEQLDADVNMRLGVIRKVKFFQYRPNDIRLRHMNLVVFGAFNIYTYVITERTFN
jgi:hypothetical protein